MVAELQPPPRIFPADYYYRDFGLNWTDLGVICPNTTQIAVYLGNGVVVIADGTNRHLYRSTDFGVTWADLGLILSGAPNTNCGVNLGNGIALLGDGAHRIWRSVDWGISWTALTPIVALQWFMSMAYCGHGIALAGDSNHHVWRSTDDGATWADLGAVATHSIGAIAYLGGGVAVLGDNNNHIFRSVDYGATWGDLGVIATNNVNAMAYLGNHKAIFGDNNGHIFRSTDDGATWTDQGVISASQITTMAYLLEDVVIFGDRANHIFRSIDLGLTWTDMGVITTNDVECLIYLDNGIVVLGEANGHLFRSVSAFQIWRGRDGLDISCRASHSIAQAIPNAVWTALDFDTVIWQTEIMHDVAVSLTDFTILTPGTYSMIARSGYVWNAAGWRYLQIQLNGATVITNQVLLPLNDWWFVLEVATKWRMNAGDIVRVRTFQNSGGPLNTVAGSPFRPSFEIARIP